ncbi:hypothetical protein Hanom_Chr10g00896411 [Helianthus anomalus]
MVREIDMDIMIFPEYNLVKYSWSKEDVPEKPPTPYRLAIRTERLERGPRSIHYTNENLVKRIMKVDEVKIRTDGVGGTYLQNRYTLLRENGEQDKVTDEDIADRLHPLDILFMKDHYEKEKKNTKEIRRALKGILNAGIKMFERVAFSEFDLCINYDYVHNKKVYLSAPDTSIPSELIENARSRDIIELPMIKDIHNYGVVYRDFEKNKALCRSVDICKYSNQTLKFIIKNMNKRQEKLQKTGMNKENQR